MLGQPLCDTRDDLISALDSPVRLTISAPLIASPSKYISSLLSHFAFCVFVILSLTAYLYSSDYEYLVLKRF
jgi:hypothetical protein